MLPPDWTLITRVQDRTRIAKTSCRPPWYCLGCGRTKNRYAVAIFRENIFPSALPGSRFVVATCQACGFQDPDLTLVVSPRHL